VEFHLKPSRVLSYRLSVVLEKRGLTSKRSPVPDVVWKEKIVQGAWGQKVSFSTNIICRTLMVAPMERCRRVENIDLEKCKLEPVHIPLQCLEEIPPSRRNPTISQSYLIIRLNSHLLPEFELNSS
jgi:hypothetical protein